MPLIDVLMAAGVRIPAPESVWIDPALTPDRFGAGVTIHPGCRIVGADTAIGPNAELGREGPLTLEHCQLGAGVRLGGGYAAEATFLDGVSLGADAHIRPGTLLEEQAAGGHAVGLKQTILMPFVTTGSLVNFCDCLMAGGTGPERHGEVGSSYVHFNFTPQQDKATASLIGDVPRGVMLDQPPVFLGGQGGLVGPAQVAFGTVVAAGTLLREDVLEPDLLVFGRRRDGARAFIPGLYAQARRVAARNFHYIGNLHALREWYRHARARTFGADALSQAVGAGAQRRLDQVLEERLKRLENWVERLKTSLRAGAALASPAPALAADLHFQAAFLTAWPARRERLIGALSTDAGSELRDRFLTALSEPADLPHVARIQRLPPDIKTLGTEWLQAIVTAIESTLTP